MLSLAMILGCIPSFVTNVNALPKNLYRADTCSSFKYFDIGDDLSDFKPEFIKVFSYEQEKQICYDYIDIDLSNVTYSYYNYTFPDTYTPIDMGTNPKIELGETYYLRMTYLLPKTFTNKYGITVDNFKLDYPNVNTLIDGKFELSSSLVGYNYNDDLTVTDAGDNLSVTVTYVYCKINNPETDYFVTINRDKVIEYTNAAAGEKDAKLDAIKDSIVTTFDTSILSDIVLEFDDEKYDSFKDDAKSINISATSNPTLKMSFKFNPGSNLGSIKKITVIEVNDSATELSRKEVKFNEDNEYFTSYDYAEVIMQYADYWYVFEDKYEVNIGYQFNLDGRDKVKIYFPEFYDYDDSTYTLKDGASDKYLPIIVDRGSQVSLPSLNKNAAFGDILGWKVNLSSSNIFTDKITANKDLMLYVADGSLQIKEHPSATNNYSVITNVPDLCEDYLTYNWYKVEEDTETEVELYDNYTDYNKSNNPKMMFKNNVSDNNVSYAFDFYNVKTIAFQSYNLPKNTTVVYKFNNKNLSDLNISAWYDYYYDSNEKVFKQKTAYDNWYVEFSFNSSEDISGTYEILITKDDKEPIDCHTKNLTADESGYYICEVYGKEDYNKLYTYEVYYEAKQTSSGSKKYKAVDTKDTTEKISGSGKKGSTRTIVPQEGRKVSSVVVTDKDGNKVDVTLNEDGTYSFVQPASNVDVQVNYKNREITLNIGSTEASVDDEKTNLDVAPILRNDRTMLPIRFVAENLGAKVGWDEKNPNIVTISRGDIKIEIKLGSNIAKVNGKEYILDSVAFAENDRTYMPVRFISEALNAIVEWNEARPNEVKIYEQ